MVTIRDTLNRILVLNGLTVAIVVVLLCAGIIPAVYYSQKWSEVASLPPIMVTGRKEDYEIAKLAAEIRQIRSDTSGSLFWLKMIALFVTVGGAVGGYLAGQSRVEKRRIEFEDRKRVYADYQAIVQELSDKAPLLRAAAAVKLGNVLKEFPVEWMGDNPTLEKNQDRQNQIIKLTKQVLAASLAIEKDAKVLKTLSIALVLHRHGEYADARELDLSGARANDAYWKKIDFSGSDFYKASLKSASFRASLLFYAQFRESQLGNAVFTDADCQGANFKMADLRNADFSNAKLSGTRFENAKIRGCKLSQAVTGDNYPDDQVDDSEEGDGSRMISVRHWLAREAPTRTN